MGRRKSYEVEGYSHGKNPIPAVSRVGDIIASGGISGRDLTTGALAETLEGQCELMFKLMEFIVETAGATVDDIVKMTVYLRKGISRDALNNQWNRYFPDADSRPVRHVIIYDNLPEKMLIQCEFLAVAPDK